MNHIFWLRERTLAGRSGPDKDPWHLDDLGAAGFSAILSVNEGEAVHETRVRDLGMAYAVIPMSANAPAQPGDKAHCLRHLPRAVRFIERHTPDGPVLIHCRSGKDRTGLVMAAYLMAAEGLSADRAMQDVLAVRPIAFSAPDWMAFGYGVLSEFKNA